ncbi:MAG: phosphatidylserine/phosphatidylglycerophosphate/cardiolipin synthase family protein [Candidatus Gracilibacteria bacterium]|nr:phosphatidylserine/phosphatidylglycerophosphate/cardiolipin synthase family protein [Candidatus Gracilibacteria bacterium]MDD2908800.1 phosphatidylserine/phosphatidylglycerophosphate/cardiolipin synthase family protein [Candidatus Gracilibacteria bacterium]
MLKLKNYLILLLLLTFTFLTGCTNEYWEYHDKIVDQAEQEVRANSTSKSFNLNNIEYRDLDILSSPDKTIIDKIIGRINGAKSRIYLETYIFTEKRILKAILDAKLRGIDIKIILEKNVFGAGNINKKTFEALQNAGVEVVYANPTNYNFTHAKFFLIDSEYIISTGNMSYSTFTINKEFFAFGKNINDLNILEDIFLNDFVGKKYIICNQTLTISPICPRNQIEQTLNSAKNEILIYEQSIDDINIQNLLIKKAKSGVSVKILIGDMNKIKNNKEVIKLFSANGINIKSPKKPYIHAKAFLVDQKIVYIGSINFTYNSIQNNREIGIIFINEAISLYFKNEFERLFANTQ